MKTDETLLSADDRRLVARIREGYAPPPLTEMDRTRFDARLRGRVEARRRRWLWGLGGLALAGAVAATAVFALRPAVAPEATPAMVAAPTAPGDVTLTWLVDEARADWLGGSTVLPADPLAVPTLDTVAAAAETDTADGTDADATDTDAKDTAPAWMPDEYTVLAGLIEIEPYDPYAEDWP